MSIREIREQLASSALRPQRRFGQNFLHDRNMACWIVDSALQNLSLPWRVWEVGPGLGVLTALLLERGAGVRAVEIDRGLAGILRDRFRGEARFQLCEGDVLREEWPDPVADWILIGNLPYSISGPFLASLFRQRASFRRVVVTLQREVAERLVAKPRQDAYGSLSVMGQSTYRVDIRKRLPPSVFYPAPKVESALICLEPLGEVRIPPEDREDFCSFVRESFQQRRKSLGRRWSRGERRRPEELSVAEWVSAYRELRKAAPAETGGSFGLT
ncbi:16S rRNA (adenine(1518)-N(6)/adenine(1519)-N(6))-dimethyltransferase RsmA [Methylacidimicrobium sp. B4]|uniref:16S rRNA (adenine(1518)-N(6)/adenine(1519)-N(6))- dimethyltransferase RsmA n=1 Tax=Methylacidimicrobium sp. B4 TaxID=2796139 RepID=UPI001A8CC8DC|nr:16S rRNA (adenine(1518)-N(6)/adenine(1519)-N(6))-dimethyltransferase RsmA [Methylacidimicrobium sp. B4]QSR84254.1 ribosomal RNA small subunit methyltransferase A [Methylacidimicrobium sp. B4]